MTNTPPLGPQNINNKISLQVLMYNKILSIHDVQWQKPGYTVRSKHVYNIM